MEPLLNYANVGDSPFTNNTVNGELLWVKYTSPGHLHAWYLIIDAMGVKLAILDCWELNSQGVWIKQKTLDSFNFKKDEDNVKASPDGMPEQNEFPGLTESENGIRPLINFARAGHPPFTNATVGGVLTGVEYTISGDMNATYFVRKNGKIQRNLVQIWRVNEQGEWGKVKTLLDIEFADDGKPVKRVATADRDPEESSAVGIMRIGADLD